MTTTDTNLNQLIINELTQAEYNTATINQNELYVITDGVMQSSDVINALGYTPANNADIDGAWTIPSSAISICSNYNISGSGSQAFALSSVLPNDSNLYEMQLYCSGETGTASGNRVQLVIGNSGVYGTITTQVFDIIARSAARVFAANTIIYLGHHNDNLGVSKNSSYTGTVSISCIAYRKVR